MNIIGMGIAGRGEADKYLKKTLEANLPLVDKMIVWGDAPDPKTEAVLLSYDKVEYHRYHESIWAQKQWLIKEALLSRYVVPHHPDWVLSFDFDELFDYRIDRAKLEELASGSASSFYFNFIQLWNNEEHMRVDKGWGDFWNVRFWKFQPQKDQSWQRKALHCGLAPVYAYHEGIFVPYIVKHYGYMDPVDRAKKIVRYNEHDPQRVYQSKSWYDSMRSEGDIRSFDEKQYIETILPQLVPHQTKESKMSLEPVKIKKVYMVRRLKDQRIQEMSENQFKELKGNGEFGRHFELVGEMKTGTGLPEAPVVTRPDDNTLKCFDCGFEAKSAFGLRSHARKHVSKN